MKSISQFSTSILLILAFLTTAHPCGPGYVSPIFVTTNAPENPYSSFAAGRLGIVKPTYRRELLLVAYRYINGGSFTPDEQKALVALWRADIDRDFTQTDDIAETIRAWVEKRKDVVGKDEKIPDIYVERSYGGYNFFPNCSKSAFETATETLADRAGNHGPSDPNVTNWLKAQDQVFGNCSSGKQTPDDPPPGAPDWLQKDRAYQKAAASFYSLDYNDAKLRFADIAQDSDSPWRETADYLVARTLIRQASLSKSSEISAPLYDEAKLHLQKFLGGNGKFSASAERLDGLIKFRRHPKERVGELAQKLSGQSGNENFRQDVIDYTWLLDKFERQTLEAEDKKKAEEAKKNDPANTAETSANIANANVVNHDNELELTFYSTELSKSWTAYVKPDATDNEALAEAEKIVGTPLTDELKKSVREARQTAYAERFTKVKQPEYDGGYYGEEKLTPSLMPAFLRNDDLTNWLFTYQMKSAEGYLYSLKKYRETGSELWLMTALSQADRTSTDLKRLLDAADQASRTSPAYFTIVFNAARIDLDLGKNAEAKKLIEEMLNSGDDLPVSVKNEFLGLRLRLAETLDDFLKYSLRKSFAFDFSGSVGSIDELMAEQKKYYDPEYNKDGREAFDREVEDRFKNEKLWQDRTMLDNETIEIMNQSFPQSVLSQVERSEALPDYLRPKFAIAIWTRAYLLDDYPTLLKITPEITKYQPEFEQPMLAVVNAKTPLARQNAALYFILKNPLFSPYIESGIGKTDNEFGQWDNNDWWCSSYLAEENGDSEENNARKPLTPPKFLTADQKQTATIERKKMIDLGDAPQMLANRVLEWALRSPADRRVPEALYIVHQANGWTKYGCGSNEELQKKVGDFMNKRYPQSEWTKKLTEDESEK